MGAGLGGGSSDAVAFLKLVNERFELNISWGELNHYAKQLGSDTVFFTANRPSYVSGRGENCELIALDLSKYFIAIVHPGIHVGTAEAYAEVTPKQAEFSLEKITELPVGEWKEKIKNDFEGPIFKTHPAIKNIKEKLYSLGAVYASMSGSGSAVYGIFDKRTNLKTEFKDCRVWEGRCDW
jgi:4-diphosphocytidyl-2-C-methyl-D-erythritol kinase